MPFTYFSDLRRDPLLYAGSMTGYVVGTVALGAAAYVGIGHHNGELALILGFLGVISAGLGEWSRQVESGRDQRLHK